MNLVEAYRKALKTIGRPEREFKPIFPQDWKESMQPCAMLVLVGAKGRKASEWPAIALVMARGTYALGRTIPGSVFPGLSTLPRFLEGHQCLLEVGEEVRIVKDVSTNGTFVIPANQLQECSRIRANVSLRKRLDSPYPKTVHHHDIICTIYAELVLILL
jgi:hypothetical protein